MSYKAPPYTLQPGERVTVQVVGREVAVIEADKSFLIATNSGEPEFIAAGLQLAPEGGFHNIVMRNPHAEAINVRLGITDGSIKDNRASVTTTLPVRDPDDLSSFSDVTAAIDAQKAALLAMMQNADDQKSPLTPLGQSYATGEYVNGVITLISPGSNVSGLLLRTVSFEGASSAVALYADTSAPVSSSDYTKRRIASGYGSGTTGKFFRDIAVEAGQGIYLAANNNGGRYEITWDGV